jgi:hypothetical protein
MTFEFLNPTRVVAGQAQHGRRAGRERPRPVDLARFARANGLVVRFIDTMDVGTTGAGSRLIL